MGHGDRRPENARSEVRRLRSYVAVPRRVARTVNRVGLTSESALGRGVSSVQRAAAIDLLQLASCADAGHNRNKADSGRLRFGRQVNPMTAVGQRLLVGPTGASDRVRCTTAALFILIRRWYELGRVACNILNLVTLLFPLPWNGVCVQPIHCQSLWLATSKNTFNDFRIEQR
jgi:hypothetical protein